MCSHLCKCIDVQNHFLMIFTPVFWTAVTETGEHCIFFTCVSLQLISCNRCMIFMWSYFIFKCSFKINFRAWLLQTAAISLLNRDGPNFKVESIISARRSRERKNRGTTIQTLVCSQKHSLLQPTMPPKSYLTSGGGCVCSVLWLEWLEWEFDYDYDLENISDKVRCNTNSCVVCVKAANNRKHFFYTVTEKKKLTRKS